MSHSFLRVLAPAVLLTLLLPTAPAADLYWDGPFTSPSGSVNGGNGTWDNSQTNWTNVTGSANSAWTSADTAIFSGTTGTVDVAEAINVANIAFDTNGYLLTGAGSLTIGSANLTINTATNVEATISTAITGSGALVKTGSGVLNIEGTNNYTGDSFGIGTRIQSGSVNVVSGATINHELAAVLIEQSGGAHPAFVINTGATVTSNDAYIGYTQGSEGSALVDGGTWESSGDFVMGQGGNGSLTIQNGGSVTSRNGYIAASAGNTGSVTVDGSTWENSLTIYVGSLGTGTLDITNGGHVSSHYFHIGEGQASEGTVNVTSGTLEISTASAIANSLYVGMLNKGTLNIGNDGIVTSAAASIGDGEDAEGTVTVTGGSWTSSDFIVVGNSGIGTLTITDGGQVTNKQSIVGYGGTGTVTVDGGTWTNTLMYLGYGGSATLNIRNGGITTVTGVVTMADGPDSIVDLKIGDTDPLAPSIDGTLSATKIVRGLGAASITLKGGLLQARADEDDFLSEFDAGDVTIAAGGAYFDTQAFTVGINAVLGGAGSFTKLGTGTLTLSATNTYTGATTVEAGTLLIVGDSSASQAFRVQDGGTLGGSGRVSHVTVDDGGTLSADTLTIEDDLTLSTGSIALFQGGEVVNVGGLLTLESDWTLTLTSGFQDGGSTILFNYGNLAGAPDLTPNFDLTALGFIPSGPLSLIDTGSSLILNGVSAIPEPTTGVLVGGGVLLLLLRRRRDRESQQTLVS